MSTLALSFTDVTLEDVSQEIGSGRVFHGSTYLRGVLHHVELIEVVLDEDDFQRANEPVYRTHLERILEIACEGGPAAPVEIDGRFYVCFVSPSCS